MTVLFHFNKLNEKIKKKALYILSTIKIHYISIDHGHICILFVAIFFPECVLTILGCFSVVAVRTWCS